MSNQSFSLEELSPRPTGYKDFARTSRLRLGSASKMGLRKTKKNQHYFQVLLNVRQFMPKEICVKVVNGCYVVVNCKHEERSDEHGFISRQFTRRYKLPDNVDPTTIKITLTMTGVLSLTAPKKVPVCKSIVIPFQIVCVNEPSIKALQQANENDKSNEDNN